VKTDLFSSEKLTEENWTLLELGEPIIVDQNLNKNQKSENLIVNIK